MKSSSETLATQEPSAPLSPSQEGLWFLHQVEPGSSAYHNVLALRFEGPLQVGVLQRSLTEICRRHEALRTRITVLDGVPRQVATPAADLPLPVVDAVAGPDGDLLGAAVRQAREEAARPFDLAAGPAIRALLLRLAADDWLLLVTVHHVVSDGTGVTILLRELVTLYPAYLAGEPSPLPDPPVGYLAAANRRSERLAGRLADGLAYWTDRLAGAPPLLELPLDRPRPLVQRFRGGSVPVELPRELTDAVREFSRREGVTVYMTFLAALQLLLHRYTGQQDILVGSQMTGRTRRELRDMVAYLVNTIVLRTEVEPELTVRQLLARARETAVGAFRHSDIPFEKVVASLRPPRSRGHHPVFQVVLSYHERGDGWLHASSFTIPTLTVSFPRLDVGASRFDLSVCVHEGGDDTLGIDFEYDSDLFDLSTVERMAGHFQQLLAGMVAAPDTPVRQLPLLTDRERELLLTEWGRGPAITPSATCLHQPFEAQATRTPTAVALAHGGEQVTYAELDRRANQLAHHLRRLGAGPGQLVGVCLRRSPELVVGLLGVLKSGAGYVFFEPSLPLERREFMIKDSAARIVLAEEATAAAVPGGVDVVVSLDAERAALDREPTGRPAEGASGDDLAYCIYTSGSTGTPKAVGIRHAGCVSFLDWAATVFEPADLAGVLASSSPMFDCPLFEVFVPLSWGGTAVLAGSLLDLPRLAGPVPVTLLMGAPTVVAQLLVGGGIPDSVRAIDLSGEAMPSDLPAQIYRSTAVQRVFNYYGISEMTTHTIGTLVPRPAAGGEDGPATMAPTIGRPIGNATVYVLDETMNPVPVGVTGELYVGGAGVARGYLGRPALTADRFLADPFGPPGARLYRSGDLARYRPDGTIEYLGRSDRQVKLRGFRVELGEVESLLGQFPGVDRAAVVLREDEPGRRRLVGYLVPAAGARPAPADVRAFLRERLPEHAVPTAFVLVDQVPVTANGKIAVAELPRPEYEAPGSVELWRLADAIETQVRMIWNDVLGTGAVEFDARATFFDLGGDSLQAVVMLGRVQEVFGVDVPIGQFMAASTIEDLSTAIRAEGWRMPPSCVVKVFGDGDQRPFFCIHPGGGELYELRYLQKEFGERPVYALMPVGWNGEAEPLASIEEMAIRYVEEVRRIQPRGPYLLAGLSLAGLIAFDMAQRFRAAGEEVAFLGLFETWPVLDGAVCLPEDAYEYQSTAEAQEIAARTGQVVIPAQELLYMKRLSPAIPALEELERGLEQRKIHDFDGLCRELAEMRAGLQAALDQLKARGLVVNELDMAAFYRMHEVAAKQIWAKSAYRPRPYPGTAVLFAGPSAELPLLTRVWTALVAELAVDQIDEEVHTELLRDPRLARALRVRIEEAESRLRPAPAGPPAAGAGTGEVD